jgi:hypothetical protein
MKRRLLTVSGLEIRLRNGLKRAGFPAKLAELIDRHQDRVLWRLIIGQPKLGGIVEGLNFLLPDWPEFEQWLNLPSVAKGSEPALMRTGDVAVALQGLAVTKKVLDELKEIHEDILGVYRFATRVGASIEIYWMANALVAGALGVRVEDLAVVTLAHELAHLCAELRYVAEHGRPPSLEPFRRRILTT